MKKIVLVTPPISQRQMYGSLESSGNTMPSLGLLFLASYVRSAGFDVSVVDSIALELTHEEALAAVLKASPDCVGISSTTITIHRAAGLAEDIKKALPSAIVILGGCHITALPQETMTRFPQFDIGVLGEGETAFLELLSALRDKRGISGIKGLIVRGNGTLIENKKAKFIDDLDILPLPAWDLLPGFPARFKMAAHSFRRFPVATLITSRGCPFGCTFCDTAVFGRRIRAHSPQYVMKMLRCLVREYGAKEIMFYDDTLVALKDRLKALCEMIISEKLGITWSCFARVDDVDEDLLSIMKRAGCWQIGYGIESASPRILEILDKKITPQKVRRAIDLTRRAGIKSKGFFMIGNFGETPDTIEETIRFALGLKMDDFQITNFTPFPGSRAYELAPRFGRLYGGWEDMNMLKISFVPSGLTKEELAQSQKSAYRRFYLRPGVVLSNVAAVFRYPATVSRLYRGGVSLMKMTAEAKRGSR